MTHIGSVYCKHNIYVGQCPLPHVCFKSSVECNTVKFYVLRAECLYSCGDKKVFRSAFSWYMMFAENDTTVEVRVYMHTVCMVTAVHINTQVT